MPGGRVRVRRAAGRGVLDLEPEAPSDRLRVLHEAPAAVELLHRPPAGHDLELDGGVGDLGRRRDVARIAASTASRPLRASSRGRRPRARTARRRRSAACRPAILPTFTVTPGQRPLRSCSSRTIRAASRIALRPFSGSTPAWAARPWTVIRTSRMPLRADTMSPLARAHSRTRHASASAARSGCAGSSVGEPISSSGLATNVEAFERQAAELAERPP